MDVDRESLFVILAVGALAPILADLPRHVRAPIVVAEILLGILVGPQVLGLAQVDPVVDVLSEFGLAFLFFLAGMEIEVDQVRGRVGALAARAWGGSLALALAAALALWATGLIGGPVLVALALCTTSLGALVPILKDAGLAGEPVGRYTMATGAAGEFGPVVALSVVLAVASGEPWRALLLGVFAAVAVGVGAVALRARPARIVRLIEATMHSSGQLAIRLSLLLLGGLVALAGELGLDLVLGAFAAGLIVGLVAGTEETHTFHHKLEGVGYGFLIPIFFIATGLTFDVDALLSDASTIALVPAFALLFLVVRGVPTWLLHRGALERRERLALALMAASALPLVVAITEIATERGTLGEAEAVALVGAGMLSLLAFPLLALARLPARGGGDRVSPPG